VNNSSEKGTERKKHCGIQSIVNSRACQNMQCGSPTIENVFRGEESEKDFPFLLTMTTSKPLKMNDRLKVFRPGGECRFRITIKNI